MTILVRPIVLTFCANRLKMCVKYSDFIICHFFSALSMFETLQIKLQVLAVQVYIYMSLDRYEHKLKLDSCADSNPCW